MDPVGLTLIALLSLHGKPPIGKLPQQGVVALVAVASPNSSLKEGLVRKVFADFSFILTKRRNDTNERLSSTPSAWTHSSRTTTSSSSGGSSSHSNQCSERVRPSCDQSRRLTRTQLLKKSGGWVSYQMLRMENGECEQVKCNLLPSICVPRNPGIFFLREMEQRYKKNNFVVTD